MIRHHRAPEPPPIFSTFHYGRDIIQPKLAWVYDATLELEEREFRLFVYDKIRDMAMTRRLENESLFAVLEKNFNHFLSDQLIRRDWKDRVQRAIQSFRRGLADNDDVLTEFFIAWTSMEGLDIVYRKLLGSADNWDFKDGVRDVFQRLESADQFEPLLSLRHGLAHGNISLADAVSLAKNNLDIVRQALVLMILRILGVGDADAVKIVSKPGYKGKFFPFVKFLAKIRFEPGDVKRLDTHPTVDVVSEIGKITKHSDKINFKPIWHLTSRNIDRMRLYGQEFWADAASPLLVETDDAEIRPLPIE